MIEERSADARPVAVLRHHTKDVSCVAVLQEEAPTAVPRDWVLSGDVAGKAILWDLSIRRPVVQWNVAQQGGGGAPSSVLSCGFLGSARLLYVQSRDQQLSAWRVSLEADEDSDADPTLPVCELRISIAQHAFCQCCCFAVDSSRWVLGLPGDNDGRTYVHELRRHDDDRLQQTLLRVCAHGSSFTCGQAMSLQLVRPQSDSTNPAPNFLWLLSCFESGHVTIGPLPLSPPQDQQSARAREDAAYTIRCFACPATSSCVIPRTSTDDSGIHVVIGSAEGDCHCYRLVPPHSIGGNAATSPAVLLWEVKFRKGVSSVVPCADGTFMCSCWDGEIRRCDSATGKERCRFVHHESAANVVVVVPRRGNQRKSTLISGGADGTVAIWSFD